MRFQMKTHDERVAEKVIWHNWFAWHPVRLPSGEMVAFEVLQRKGRQEPTGPMWSPEWRYDYCEFSETPPKERP